MIDGEIQEIQVTIPNGSNTSDTVSLDRGAVIRIRIPAAFDGSALTFQEGTSSGTMLDVVKDGAVVEVPVAPSQSVVLPPADFCGFTSFRVKSLSTESGARVLTLVTRRV